MNLKKMNNSRKVTIIIGDKKSSLIEKHWGKLTIVVLLILIYYIPRIFTSTNGKNNDKTFVEMNNDFSDDSNLTPKEEISFSDLAKLMDDRVLVNSVAAFPELSLASSKYRVTAAILAYLQIHSLRESSVSRELPWLMINGVNSCKKELSIGVYYPNCSLIGIDFADGNQSYEKAEEVITVIAHEWGHHLAKISNLDVSRNEGEIVSDCFAGLVMGLYYKKNMITIEEMNSAAEMMIQLGNNSSTGIHPNSQTRLQAFLGAFASIAIPDHDSASLYGEYCASLNQILDKDKIATVNMTEF